MSATWSNAAAGVWAGKLGDLGSNRPHEGREAAMTTDQLKAEILAVLPEDPNSCSLGALFSVLYRSWSGAATVPTEQRIRRAIKALESSGAVHSTLMGNLSKVRPA